MRVTHRQIVLAVVRVVRLTVFPVALAASHYRAPTRRALCRRMPGKTVRSVAIICVVCPPTNENCCNHDAESTASSKHQRGV